MVVGYGFNMPVKSIKQNFHFYKAAGLRVWASSRSAQCWRRSRRGWDERDGGARCLILPFREMKECVHCSLLPPLPRACSAHCVSCLSALCVCLCAFMYFLFTSCFFFCLLWPFPNFKSSIRELKSVHSFKPILEIPLLSLGYGSHTYKKCIR